LDRRFSFRKYRDDALDLTQGVRRAAYFAEGSSRDWAKREEIGLRAPARVDQSTEPVHLDAEADIIRPPQPPINEVREQGIVANVP
jgi:hypothetical protein